MQIIGEILGSFLAVAIIRVFVEFLYKKANFKNATVLQILGKYIIISIIIYTITYFTNMDFMTRLIYLIPLITFALYEVLKLQLIGRGIAENEQLEIGKDIETTNQIGDLSLLKRLLSNPTMSKLLGFLVLILAYILLNFILVFAQDVYHANDITVYTQFEEELNNQNSKLTALKDQYISLEQSLDEEYEWIEMNEDNLQTNEEVDDYNLRVNDYNDKLNEYKEILATYNQLVDKYNSELEKRDELYKKAYDRWYIIPIPMPRATR